MQLTSVIILWSDLTIPGEWFIQHILLLLPQSGPHQKQTKHLVGTYAVFSMLRALEKY